MNNSLHELLEKTRTISRLILQSGGYQMDFDAMCSVLAEVLGSSVYILSRRGKVLGHCFAEQFEPTLFEDNLLRQGRVSDDFNAVLLRFDGSAANQDGPSLCGETVSQCPFSEDVLTIVPISGGSERLGTLVLGKNSGDFDLGDLLVAEYGATVVGMEIVRARGDKLEQEVRQKAACQIAIGTLSFSEQEAVESIFDELAGEEGLLVASRVADRAGITRSVIVNALRKLESANIIESRSLGMKGTYIRVLNEFFLDELADHRSR